MSQNRLLIAFALAASMPAFATAYSQWSVGTEREVDEGYYFKLLNVKNGWRLWRIETAREIDCRAVKSVIGKRHPFPLGVSMQFYNGPEYVPYLTIFKNYKGDIRYAWDGRDYENDVIQVRKPGDRFWTVDKGNINLIDGEKLEVSVASWEYPSARVGYHKVQGVIDLTGLDSMVSEIGRCSISKAKD